MVFGSTHPHTYAFTYVRVCACVYMLSSTLTHEGIALSCSLTFTTARSGASSRLSVMDNERTIPQDIGHGMTTHSTAPTTSHSFDHARAYDRSDTSWAEEALLCTDYAPASALAWALEKAHVSARVWGSAGGLVSANAYTCIHKRYACGACSVWYLDRRIHIHMHSRMCVCVPVCICFHRLSHMRV